MERFPLNRRMSLNIRFSLLIVAVLAISIAPSLAKGSVLVHPHAIVTLPPEPSAAVIPPIPHVARGYNAPVIAPSKARLVGITQKPFVGISIQDAIGMALHRNTNLIIAQANRRIAGYQIEAAKGSYDVRFQIVPSFMHSGQAPANAFFAGPNFGPIEQNRQGLGAGVAGILPDGQSYNVSISELKTDNNTTLNTFNPYYPTNISVSFLQPLLRGASISDASKGLKLAAIGSDLANAQTLAAASSTIAGVEDAYWDLVAAWRNVAIQEDALKQAVAQQKSNIRLAKRGAAATIDAVESSTQVEIFQQDVFLALQNVSALQNELKAELIDSPTDKLWEANLVPTSPVLTLPEAPSLTTLVKNALAQRPEMREALDARKRADVQLAFARDRLKPKLDLSLGYQSNGFSGSLAPPNAFSLQTVEQDTAINALIAAVNATLPPGKQIPPLANGNQATPGYLIGNLGQSIANLLGNKFPTYSAQVTFSLPMGRRSARAGLAQAMEQEKIAQTQEAGTIERIIVEARNALQAYQTSLSSLQAAHAARQASAAVFASELRKFRNGASTTFLVLQRQVQLAQSRGLELQSQTNLNKAVVEIQRVSGAILSRHHVQARSVGNGLIR